MRLYIDSADVAVVESLMKTGLFHGVTTNPLILRDAGVGPDRLADLAGRLLALGAGEIFLQSWGEDLPALRERGRELARIDAKVVVKLPATREGLAAASALAGEGVATCVTAVYAPYQALLAAAAGAAYVAPYLGRMNDAGRDGHAMIAMMSLALQGCASPCRILAASIRSPDDLATLACGGVRSFTLSPAVAERLFQEPLTMEAVRVFQEAAPCG